MIRGRGRARLSNLERLIAEAGSAARLARLAQTNPSYLSQIRRQLKTARGTARGVGDDLAHKLEQAMGKPEGWMDVLHPEAHEDPPVPYVGDEASPDPGARLHPLISWPDAKRWNALQASFSREDADHWLPCPVPCSPDTFVLRVEGESMAPRIGAGELLFVDPRVAPKSSHFVIACPDPRGPAVLGQLIVEGGEEYLRALNPDWPTRILALGARAAIVGVVCFKGEHLLA